MIPIFFIYFSWPCVYKAHLDIREIPPIRYSIPQTNNHVFIRSQALTMSVITNTNYIFTNNIVRFYRSIYFMCNLSNSHLNAGRGTQI